MDDGGRTSLQLADEAMEAGNVDTAIVELSAAVRRFTADGDNRSAALASARLGDLFHNVLGNRVAARSWFTRAMRLVEAEEPCVEQGWAAIAMLGCEVDDPDVLWQRATYALERARRFGDIDLEIKALADAGLALVQAGRLVEGMEMLDESMALACAGGTTDPYALGKSVCSFYTACGYTADFERVASWSATFRQRGIINPEPGPGLFLTGHCDSVRATLLCHLGRWSEAEEVLVRTHGLIVDTMPGAAYHTPVALAELRLLQGRLDEAEALLLGRDDSIHALLPTARLLLERGDLDLACAAARRGLRLMAADRLRVPKLLAVVVEAELRKGELDAAAEASDELDARVAGLGVPAATAEAARVRALVLAAQGSAVAAVEALRGGLDALAGTDLSYLRMVLHLALARVLQGTDRAPAEHEARLARTLLEQLDVTLAPDDVDLLAQLCSVSAPPRAPIARVAVLVQGGPWWTAGCGDTRVRLRDTKGLRYLAELVAHPGVERHVIDLVDLVEGVAPDGPDRRALGDAGEVVDASARVAYRRRIEALRNGVEDALDAEDDHRAAQLQSDLDDLVAELARAFGLGGRDRRAASTAEKARLNVTRALRSALAKLTEALPEAGATLDRRTRTGTFCAYEPQADDIVRWDVQRALNGIAAR
jgi:tetratricopeptide (TPR) repeat protein